MSTKTNDDHPFIGDELDLIRGKPFYSHTGQLIGYPFDLVDLISKYTSDILPEGLGVYHLFYQDELVYVGMSKCVKKRLLEHLRCLDMVFDQVLWFMTPDRTVKEVLDIERRLIKLWNPKLNVSRGYGSSNFSDLFTQGEIHKVIFSLKDLSEVEKMELYSKFVAIKQ
jgi:hypothetical protein